MKNKNLVSVIIATFNRSNILPRCLESVLSQTYQNLEIIIVDDGSSDNTNNVIKRYKKKDNRIKYFRHNQNKGNASARNTAVKNSKGFYVAFIDDDDEWIDKNKIEKQVKIFKKKDDKNLGIVCSGIVRCKLNGKQKVEKLKAPRDIKYQVLKGGYIHNSTVLTKKSIIKKVGGFDLKVCRGVDSEFFRKLVVIYNYKVFFMKEITCKYYENSPNRMSINNNIEGSLGHIKSQYFNIKKYFLFLIIRPKILAFRLYLLVYMQYKYLFYIVKKYL